jgi:hypothetical protein
MPRLSTEPSQRNEIVEIAVMAVRPSGVLERRQARTTWGFVVACLVSGCALGARLVPD